MIITEYLGILCVTLADGTQFLQQGCSVWIYASHTDTRGTCLTERTDGTQDGLLRLVERSLCRQAQVEGAIHHDCAAPFYTGWAGPAMMAYHHGFITGHDVCTCIIRDIHGNPLPSYSNVAVSV